MSDHEGGDNKFLSGLLVGMVIGLVLGGGAGGVLLQRSTREAMVHAEMLAAVQKDAEVRGQLRAEELARANQRVKELEAKLAGK